MAKKQRKYDMEYKIQAVKLVKEFGGAKVIFSPAQNREWTTPANI